MEAGKLRTKIYLLAPSNIQNGAAETVTSTRTVSQTNADHQTKEATEVLQNGVVITLIKHTFSIRYRADLKSDWRISLDGTKELNISAIIEQPPGRKISQVITCYEVCR